MIIYLTIIIHISKINIYLDTIYIFDYHHLFRLSCQKLEIKLTNFFLLYFFLYYNCFHCKWISIFAKIMRK